MLESTVPHGASVHGPAWGDQGLTPRTAGSAPQCFAARPRRRLGVDGVSSPRECPSPSGKPSPQAARGPVCKCEPGSCLSGCPPVCPSAHHSIGLGGLPTPEPRACRWGASPTQPPPRDRLLRGALWPVGPGEPPRARRPCLPLSTGSLLCRDLAFNAQVSTTCPGEEAPPITLRGLLTQSRGSRDLGAGSSSGGWGALGQAQPGGARTPGHCCPY